VGGAPVSTRVSVRWEAGAEAPHGQTRRAVSAAVRRAVRVTLLAEGASEGEISVALVGDDVIAELNRKWLGHDGPTDVIAFPLYEQGEAPSGDIYVDVLQGVRQANALGIDPAEEIVRLAIHAILHVLGHDHPEGEDRVETPMWQIQERLVREVLRV
jgi:probable rRNA maturation factor